MQAAVGKQWWTLPFAVVRFNLGISGFPALQANALSTQPCQLAYLVYYFTLLC